MPGLTALLARLRLGVSAAEDIQGHNQTFDDAVHRLTESITVFVKSLGLAHDKCTEIMTEVDRIQQKHHSDEEDVIRDIMRLTQVVDDIGTPEALTLEQRIVLCELNGSLRAQLTRYSLIAIGGHIDEFGEKIDELTDSIEDIHQHIQDGCL